MKPLIIPQNGLHIDRSSLPQVKSDDIPDYIHWLQTQKHILSTRTEVPASSLHPSQGNFNLKRVKELMTKEQDNLKKPVVISSDHFVVDGHHRWLAALNLHPEKRIPVILVHAKIMDLLALTKEYPKSTTKHVVESFKTIIEATEKHAVLAFGRMNPPTSGHEKLVNKVHDVAEKHDAHHEVVLSHSQDPKKNPLSVEQKVKHAQRAFPKTNIVAATKERPTIFHHAEKLHKAGYQHLHVVAGKDRAQEYQQTLQKYNGKFNPEGHGYKFKSITVHSAGERQPESPGVEGMSASKMRHHASGGNFKEFQKGVSSHMTPEHTKELYHDVRQGMKHLEEQFNALIVEGVHDAGIFKAVFLSGAPGSGKDFVLKKALHGHGLTELNSDHALEYLLDKHKLDKKMPEHEKKQFLAVRDKAKSLNELRQRLAIQGRNGLIINGTGAEPEKIKEIKKHLEALGYDTKMIFVDTTDDVSRKRNIERGQRGGRSIPEKIRADKWNHAQDARVEFAKVFGKDGYHEFNNDEDLRDNPDPQVHAQKTKELDELFKTVKKFTEQPPKSQIAHEWIHANLGKLAKQPPGNKKQQASVHTPIQDSEAAQEARKLGLQYMGYGRYGKEGRVTHFSLHGKLVEKQKALTPPKSFTPAPKKLDEAFEELLTEDEHVNLRLHNHLENSVLVGRSGKQVSKLVLSEARSRGAHNSGTTRGPVLLSAHRGSDMGTTEKEIHESQEASIQEVKKISLKELKERLVVNLTEGEPTFDTVDGPSDPGPIFGMGTGAKEELDMTNGGIATKGPKKYPKKLRKGYL